MDNFEDKTIKCCDCGEDFTFTANEQQFYKDHGLTNEPKRCKACRDKKKAQKSGNRFNKYDN